MVPGEVPRLDAQWGAMETDTRHDVPVAFELKAIRRCAIDCRNRSTLVDLLHRADGRTPDSCEPSRKRFVSVIFTSHLAETVFFKIIKRRPQTDDAGCSSSRSCCRA